VQQRQRHAGPLAFGMEVREVRRGPRRAGRLLGAVDDDSATIFLRNISRMFCTVSRGVAISPLARDDR